MGLSHVAQAHGSMQGEGLLHGHSPGQHARHTRNHAGPRPGRVTGRRLLGERQPAAPRIQLERVQERGLAASLRRRAHGLLESVHGRCIDERSHERFVIQWITDSNLAVGVGQGLDDLADSALMDQQAAGRGAALRALQFVFLCLPCRCTVASLCYSFISRVHSVRASPSIIYVSPRPDAAHRAQRAHQVAAP